MVLNDMMPDTESNKKLNHTVTEFFIKGRKINISLVFTSESHFKVPKAIG